MYETFDDVIKRALNQGKEVKLKLCEKYGFKVVIDDDEFFNNWTKKEQEVGMPWETFEYPLKTEYGFTENQLKKCFAILKNNNTRA